MNAMKKLFATMLVLVLLVGLAGVVGAVKSIPIDDIEPIQPLVVRYIEINGDQYNDGDTLVVERGDNLEIRVRLHANQHVEDMQVEATIYGYEYGDIERDLVSDITSTFDMDAGDTRTEELEITIPIEMEKEPTKLRILVTNGNDDFAYIYNIQLRVTGIDRDHSVIIQDFSLSPSTVMAGRGLTGLVKVKNIGDKDFDFVKVTMSIPALGVDATEYLDELNADEAATFSELELTIPENAQPGVYDVVVRVEFDKYGVTEATGQVTVIENPAYVEEEGKTTITLPGEQGVMIGEEVAFPIIITNEGTTAKTYTLSVKSADWATTRFEPGSAVVVNGGESKTVYLYVSPLEGVEPGSKTLTITISDGTETQDAVLMARVAEKAGNAWETAKLVIEIVLIVLVLALVILGLVLALRKGKREEEEEPYY